MLLLRSAARGAAAEAADGGGGDIVNLGCILDWNANNFGADGTDNIRPSLGSCKAQCEAIPRCVAGLYVTDGPREGECWLSTEVRRRPLPCGAPCLAFGKRPAVFGLVSHLPAPPSLGLDCDWNANGAVAPGFLNYHPSLESCEAHCQAEPECEVGLYVTGGPRRGECWLSNQQREAPIHCQASCTPFVRPRVETGALAFPNGIKGSFEKCASEGAGQARICLRLSGATLQLGTSDDTVLDIHDQL